MLRRGLGTPGEIAELAGVSRQLVESWAKVAGVDWRRMRRAALGTSFRKFALGEIEAVSKRQARKIAAEAMAEWEKRHGQGSAPADQD
jgi:hypothetical protein